MRRPTRHTIHPSPSTTPDPSSTFHPANLSFLFLRSQITQPLPLPDQLSHMSPYLRLEPQHALRRKDVRYELAFAGVVLAVARVEEATLEGDESVVKLRLQSAVTMSINDGECVGGRDGDVVGRDADERAWKASGLETRM